MSNKNLKVYKIQFITEVKTLHLNVKFPCEIRMTWKRSNESAQTKNVKLDAGKAIFNQTLRLNVNMYFDTTTNKFVQKKCIYSFLILTEKGQKSAGSVTYDLSDFFNKRVYDIQDSFLLQKCPVKDTKVDMKIHYEQSIQSGYDSMSQISMTSQLDVSANNPLDLSEMNQSHDNYSQKSNSTVEGTKSVLPQPEVIKQTRQQNKGEIQTIPQNYENLNDSDVDSEQFKSRKYITEKKQDYGFGQKNKQNRIGDNIKGIQNVTHKLNDFVGKFKSTLTYDVQQKKRKINQLTQQLQTTNQLNKRLETQLKQQKNLKHELELTISSLKCNSSQNEVQKDRKIEQLQRKLDQQRKNLQKLQKRLTEASSKGEQEKKYIDELKQQFKGEQLYLNGELQKATKQVLSQKNQKSQAESKYKRSEQNYSELNQKYDRLLNKYETLQNDLKKRQDQIEETRINLDRAVENLVDSLSNIL